MKTAVIISTYNSPAALEKVLWGYAAQTCQKFELFIADDGSGQETRKLIERFDRDVMPIKHVWHEDIGFRKCTILNQTIAAANFEYLIFSDGDCIPRNDFVETHLALSEPGRFLSGGTIWLPPELSQSIGHNEISRGQATDPTWLRANGLRASFKERLRLGTKPRLQEMWDRLTPTRPTLNGHNFSAWRSDIINTNGFDERMGYGGLDRELGERLENAGVRGKQVRHRAVCVHLHHRRGYESAQMWRHNYAIRKETRKLRRTATLQGIDNLSDILPFPQGASEFESVDRASQRRKAA